jgi:hypothetical protein
MTKIIQVNNGDSGLVSRNELNQTIETVEVDGIKVTGDGNVGTELTADTTQKTFLHLTLSL